LTAEKELLISILKLTKNGAVQRKLICEDTRMAHQLTEEMLEKFSQLDLISLNERLVETSSNQRLRIVIQAIKLGADPERACKFLAWDEFENFAVVAFKINQYKVKKHFRFKWAGRRWEIDILGCKKPIIVCVDCKHWHRGWSRYAVIRTVKSQISRTQSLAEGFHPLSGKAGLARWTHAELVPVVLSLAPAPFKFYNDVPIVPILQLQDFLNELPGHTNYLKCFKTS
jgi:Holliday junction resolvase-like predicted endonuclease